MKFFGEYLIERKLISAEQLVSAIIEQDQQRPTTFGVALNMKFLTPEQVVTIFNTQQEKKCDFLSAASATGLLNGEQRKQIEKEIQTSQTPLTQILLKNKALNVKDLVHALDEFLSTAQPVRAKSKTSTSGNKTTSKKEQTSQTETIDPIFGKELQLALEEVKMTAIVNTLQLIKQNSNHLELVTEFFEDSLKNINSIRGFAKAANAKLIDEVLTQADQQILSLLKSESINDPTKVETLANTVEESLRFVVQIKDYIAKHQTEEGFLEQGNHQAVYGTLNSKFAA